MIRQRSILVCDSDVGFLGALQEAAIPHASFISCKTEVEAQHKAANHQIPLAAICINPGICDPGSVPLIRFCRSYRPATPITLISNDSSFPPADFDLAALHVQSVIHKPLTPAELVKKLIPATVFELDKAIELSRKDSTAAGGTAELDDAEMHAIEAESFLCGSVSFFDVYVKISNKRYIKILKAKDNFDVERVGSYLRKGVRYFFIKKEAQIYFLQYCDKLTEAILNRPDFSAELKQRQVLNLGRETSSLLRSIGLSEVSVMQAGKFVDYTHKLAKDSKLSSEPTLGPLLSQLKESEHCAGTVMIVSLLLTALDFRDEDVIAVIALGAFLHDVGLYMLPNKLGERDYDQLNEEERAVYETHPTLGADAVSQVKQISPLVIQIVRQHHERRDRHGYPAKLGPGAIAPMAEIIGIADCFQELLAKAAKDPAINPLEDMEQKHFDNFSFQTVEGFRKAFFPSTK